MGSKKQEVYRPDNYLDIPREETKQTANRFWEAGTKIGRPTLFESPETLLAEGIKYFEWTVANPLYKSEVRSIARTKFEGGGSEVVIVDVPVMRALTKHGLEQFLGVSRLDYYKSKEGFKEVIEYFDSVIYRYKYEGAAAGLLDSAVIIRDLGLKDAQDITSNGKEIGTSEKIVNITFSGRPQLGAKKEKTDKYIDITPKKDGGS